MGYSQPREGVIEICSKHVGSEVGFADPNLHFKSNSLSELAFDFHVHFRLTYYVNCKFEFKTTTP